MTAEELIEALRDYDPSTLVCIDTFGGGVGSTGAVCLSPCADKVSSHQATISGITYDTVTLSVSDWPKEG